MEAVDEGVAATNFGGVLVWIFLERLDTNEGFDVLDVVEWAVRGSSPISRKGLTAMLF